ncbi:TetR/AcrR family transcriptional regulator [Streptomyces sp. ISID311]|uniref:TetR/AcrR family transcriptional regulator n=1 Tax=Streptomyces sp. ISID311 TaxID=2601673 RepID=UPI0011BD3237|nr:TetR/AcrR family transcriptional regulator [Streptomyces sp. ISID311]TXC97444.1 TetR/AcrR family transcriptional regulator [Streptomyces sp. ISID311]
MPKRVDHAERRTEIAEALLRVAARRGLHAVGMRDVAAEAGVSLRLVQYYFETKEKLLLYGLQHLAERFGERVTARVRAAGHNPGPRAMIEAMLRAALPTDEESRTFHLVYTSYAVLSVTDQVLAAQPFIANPDAAESALVALLRQAEEGDLIQPGVDARLEAVSLLAMSAGLGTSILVGQRSPESAATVLDHHLDRIFRGNRADAGTRTRE